MTKNELLDMRNKLYEFLSTIEASVELANLHRELSQSLYALEYIGYDKGWIDRWTNEIIEDDDLELEASK